MKKVIISLVVVFWCLAAQSQQWYTSNSFNYRDINGVCLFNTHNMVTVGGNFTLDSIQSISTSQNAGLTWNPISDNVSSWVVSVDFADSVTGLTVGTNGKLLKTINGGSSWSPLSSPLNRDYNKVLYTGEQTAIVAGGRAYPSQGSIIKTTNGGTTWSVVYDSAGPVIRSVAFATGTTGYAVGDSGLLLKTIDGGNSWLVVNAPLQRNYYSIWFADSNTGIIAGGDALQRTILRTTDGGDNWSVVMDETGTALRDVHFFSADSGYTVGGNATMLATNDGGLNWTPVTVTNAPSNSQFNAVRFLSKDFGVVCATAGYMYVYTKTALPQVYTTSAELSNVTNVNLSGLTNTLGYPAYYTYAVADNLSFTNAVVTYPRAITAGALIPANDFVYGLNANTRYYTYLEVRTYAGAVSGEVLSFYTGNTNQAFSTQPASNVTGTAAQLNGLVAGYNYPINLRFEYGTTPALGSTATAVPATVSDISVHAVNATVSSLQPATLYYYRLKGSSAQGDFTGNLQVFSTTGYTPYTAISTDSVFNVASGTATVTGTVTGFTIAAQLYFDYSMQPGFWSSVAASPAYVTGSTTQTIQGQLYGLLGATTYYTRLRAVTALGEYYGDTILFTTLPDEVVLKTMPATNINSTKVTLNGFTRNTGVPLNVDFLYGTTANPTTVVAAIPGNTNDTLEHTISADLTGLLPNTIYYYRARSLDSSNVYAYGEVRQFYTAANTVPNWDFNNWTASSVKLPYNWRSEGQPNGLQQVAGHTGNYAMKVWGETFAVMGKIRSSQAGDGPDFFNPIPFNFRPDSIVLFANYDIQPGDTAIMLVVQYSQGVQVANNFYPLVAGNSGGVFKRVAVKLNYTSSATPDSILLGIIPTNAIAGPPAQNNSVIVDDISFTPAGGPVLENAGFENWVTFNRTTPDDWRSFTTVGYNFTDAAYQPMVVQAPSVAPNDIAAEVRTLNLDGATSLFEGSMSSLSGIFNEGASFPVHIRHQTFNGLFKYNRANDDEMNINVKLFKQGQVIGYGQLAVAQSIPDFTMFNIVINYNDTASVPDSAAIGVSASKNYPAGASIITVDKFGFDGFYDTAFINTAIGELPGGTVDDPFSVEIYPNPSAGVAYVNLQHAGIAQIDVYTLTGAHIQTSVAYANTTPLYLSGYMPGIYIVKVTAKGHSVSKRLALLEAR